MEQRFGRIARTTTCTGLVDEWLAQHPRPDGARATSPI
jgi:hypothetical protein